jgi:hypothetical protein
MAQRKGPDPVATGIGAKGKGSTTTLPYHKTKTPRNDGVWINSGSGPKLTRAQRRQFEKLEVHVDEVTASDRLYFEQHPHRIHRIRSSHPCEIAQHEIVEGRALTLPPGMRWYTVVKNIIPGVRARLYAPNYDNAPTDAVDEVTARKVYARLEDPRTQAFEEALRATADRTSEVTVQTDEGGSS